MSLVEVIQEILSLNDGGYIKLKPVLSFLKIESLCTSHGYHSSSSDILKFSVFCLNFI